MEDMSLNTAVRAVWNGFAGGTAHESGVGAKGSKKRPSG
jgi:hypothetical protein